MTSTCRHCGERIVLVNWSMGPGWTHQPEGAQDQHVYCHTSHAAEPSPLPPKAGVHPCGCWRDEDQGHHKLDCMRRS